MFQHVFPPSFWCFLFRISHPSKYSRCAHLRRRWIAWFCSWVPSPPRWAGWDLPRPSAGRCGNGWKSLTAERPWRKEGCGNDVAVVWGWKEDKSWWIYNIIYIYMYIYTVYTHIYTYVYIYIYLQYTCVYIYISVCVRVCFHFHTTCYIPSYFRSLRSCCTWNPRREICEIYEMSSRNKLSSPDST